MDINYNTLNGLIIFIVILLFIPFTQYNYNDILGYIITILLSLSILGFFIVKKWINLFVCLYLFLLFIFYWVSSIYKDNYSIQSLIDQFEFKENDILRFDLLFSTNADNEQCKVKGEYKQIFRDDEDDSKNFENINFEDKGDLCNKIKDKDSHFIYGYKNELTQEQLDIIEEKENIDIEEEEDKLTKFINENKSILFAVFILIIVLFLIYLFYTNSGETTEKSSENIVQARDIEIDSNKTQVNISGEDSGNNPQLPETPSAAPSAAPSAPSPPAPSVPIPGIPIAQ